MNRQQAHAFDFVYGDWHIHNTKLRDVSDPTCDEWVDFEATSEVFPILQGIGHIDQMHVPAPPDGDPFEGFTLRLFDPSTATWSIWWSSTRAPGRLEPPVVGHFTADVGTFECDDIVGGQPVRVRFEWRCNDTSSPTWQQFFSYDAGKTWQPNWLMAFRR